jgi:hypothetical protein
VALILRNPLYSFLRHPGFFVEGERAQVRCREYRDERRDWSLHEHWVIAASLFSQGMDCDMLSRSRSWRQGWASSEGR